jgi:hypothetical protein
MDMVYADDTSRIRALLIGSMTSAWYEATDEERRERILPRFAKLMEEWRHLGANVLATLDDDLLMVGHPQSTGNTFYVLLEINTLDDVVKMIQRIRETVDGVRLDAYMRWEARIGRPFFLLEPP